MKYLYLVKEFKPALLQNELNIMGEEGWDCFFIGVLLRPPVGVIDNYQRIEPSYQCFFKKRINESNRSENQKMAE